MRPHLRGRRAELRVSSSLRRRAGLSMQKREFISTTCVSSPQSTFTRTIRVIDYREDDSRYRLPIERDAQLLAQTLPVESEVILLGSIATGKYVDVLMTIFRDRLRFPSEFIGRGDMSRGGLMLRCATDRQELSYVAIAGAIVNGKRPPKLAPRSYADKERRLGQPSV